MRPTRSLRSRSLIEGINVTPLTDVALTLLVIMMITATFLNTEAGINLQLPTGRSADAENLGGIRIAIGARGEVFVNGVQVPLERLGDTLVEVSQGDVGQPVVLQVDRAADYEHFFQAIDIARLVGLSNFTLASELPPPPGQESEPSSSETSQG